MIFRLAAGLSFLAHCWFAFGGQLYEVIEKDGLKGLKASDGTILIPTVYEELGWSDGSELLFGDLIGYKLGNGWGLVNTKNKVVSPPNYYRLTIWDDYYIKAAIKGKFSNHLFYGLINQQGKVVLSCNYFDVEDLEGSFVVSNYQAGSIVKGLLNATFRLVIPVKYHSIELVTSTIAGAQLPSGKWQFFTLNGTADPNQYDGYSVAEERLLVHAGGRHGILSSEDLHVIQPVLFKTVTSEGEMVPYPVWEVKNLNLDSVSRFTGDSLGLKGGIFFTHINGNQEVIIDGNTLFPGQTVHIKFARDGFLIAEDQLTQQWSLVKTSGGAVIEKQDSIWYDGAYFTALYESGWQVFNRFGRKLSPRNFEAVGTSVLNLVPVKRNGYWALMDFQGEMVTQFKFDSILGGVSNRVIVDYLGNKGLIDLYGEWMIKPGFDHIWMTENLVAAAKGDHWKLYTLNGKEMMSLTAKQVAPREGWLAFQSPEGLWGIISSKGEYIADPLYDEVGKVGDILYGQDGTHASLYLENGRQLASANERIQALISVSDQLYKIRKDDKIGYVDEEARLRIANRYEDGGLFAEDRLPIKILGRWGYVNSIEQLVIQPAYDSAGGFDQGVAIVKKEGLYGLINSRGEELLACEYLSMSHQKGQGYIFNLDDDAWGAANSNGQITLTPNYLEIREASNGLLMVNRSGSWGIINPEGYTLVPFAYNEILQKEDYFLLKRLTD